MNRLRTLLKRLLHKHQTAATTPIKPDPGAPDPTGTAPSGSHAGAQDQARASSFTSHSTSSDSPGDMTTATPLTPTAVLASPRRTPRRIQASTIRLGKELGSGGQGRVHVLLNDPSRVAKLFTHPIPGGEDEFDRIIESERQVTSRLVGQPITVTWPEQALVSSSGLHGYVMPRIPEEFYFEIHTRLGKRRKLQELMFAIPRKQAIAAVAAPSDLERLALVRLVAAFLDAMHHSDLVYGDISWINFSFTLQPLPRLCVLDFDSTRRVGGPPFTRKPAAHTPDWHDPSLSADSPLATLDIDRYKFALLVLRLLVTRDYSSPLDTKVTVGPVTGLGSDQVALIQHLLRRAAGPTGTRPQLSEWNAALGG